MKILVPVKRVSDPDNANKVKVSADGKSVTTEGLEWKPNPFDEYAVETALRLNENAKGTDKLGETIVVTLGPKDCAQTLRQALAMGADRGILVEADDNKLDSLVVARALKAIVEKERIIRILLQTFLDFSRGDRPAVSAVTGFTCPAVPAERLLPK